MVEEHRTRIPARLLAAGLVAATVIIQMVLLLARLQTADTATATLPGSFVALALSVLITLGIVFPLALARGLRNPKASLGEWATTGLLGGLILAIVVNAMMVGWAFWSGEGQNLPLFVIIVFVALAINGTVATLLARPITHSFAKRYIGKGR